MDMTSFVLGRAAGGGGGGDAGGGGWAGDSFAPSNLPEDGKTRIGLFVPYIGWSYWFGIQNSIDGAGEIDWGDGSAKTKISGTSYAKYTHEFAKMGRVIVTIDPGEGKLTLGTNSSSNPFVPSASQHISNLSLVWIVYGAQDWLPRYALPSDYSLGLREIRFDSTCESTDLPSYAMGSSNNCLQLYTFPKNLQNLGGYFGIMPGITELEFPASLSALGASFGGYGSKYIRRIRFNSIYPPSGSWITSGWQEVVTISVPVGSLAAYEAFSSFPHTENFVYVEE